LEIEKIERGVEDDGEREGDRRGGVAWLVGVE